jgi:hypothetical protein
LSAKKKLNPEKISYIELENFVFCPKNALCLKKWEHTCFQKKIRSSKFWQVIVNFGRFVGFKDQLGFFEFFYELALANHAKKAFSKQVCPYFLPKNTFFGQNTKFSSSMWEIFPRSKFFFLLKSLRKVQIC